jgi:polyhydroxyalkanoate synthesis regulator phasin
LQLKFDTLDVNSFKKIKALNAEISELQNQLSIQKTAYTNLEKERDELKKDFAKKEDKLLEEIVESEHMITHLEELVVKKGQSSQTMHMIANQTNPIYHTKHKMALGNKPPCNLKKAQQEQNCLFNGNVLFTKHDPPIVRDSVETIELVEESINKMKQKNPDLKPIDYNKLNKLSGITFVPQTEPSVFSIKRPFAKYFSKKKVVSKSLSKIEQMSSNNTFNTSEARDILDDVKKRIQELQNIVESKITININNWHSSFHIEQKKVFENEITIPLNNISARVIHFENAFLKETADFVKDHKSLVNEANESRENMNVLEKLNDSLFEAVMTTDIMSIILQTYSVQDDERLRDETSAIVSKYENALIKLEKENVSFFKQLDRKSEECKYDKLSYERAFKNMKEQYNLLRTQLESHKGKGEETKFAKPSTSEKPNVSNTVTKPKMSISRFAPKVDVQKDFTKPVTPTPLPKQSNNNKIVDKGKAVVNTPKVLAPGLFRIGPTNASASTSKINACKKDDSKESSDAKKDNNINPNACALPSTGLESTSRSSRLKPRSNTRNNRVSSASTSSSKNKVKEVEEHPRNLSLCNKKHDSSECNVESTGSNACNDSVCLICKKCLINDVHDECVSKNVYVSPE